MNATAITLEVTRDGRTARLQLAIWDHATGRGSRLTGPKFNGSQELLLTYGINADDAAEIRRYLDTAFPAEVAR